VDRTQVSNFALSCIDVNDRISSPSDDTKPAREIDAVWDQVRLATLRGGNWNCATERFLLAALALGQDRNPSADKIYPYLNAYKLPAESLRFRDILDPFPSGTDFQIESGRILTKTSGGLRVRCIVDRPNPGDWDSQFTDAFAWHLGFMICGVLTGDQDRKARAWQIYTNKRAAANQVDAIENPPEAQVESDWIMARFGV